MDPDRFRGIQYVISREHIYYRYDWVCSAVSAYVFIGNTPVVATEAPMWGMFRVEKDTCGAQSTHPCDWPPNSGLGLLNMSEIMERIMDRQRCINMSATDPGNHKMGLRDVNGHLNSTKTVEVCPRFHPLSHPYSTEWMTTKKKT